MFKTTSDRLNYGNMITPPAGYVLEKAVGTTYSLDLEALTAICISLGLLEDTDSEIIKNPIGMLNALQKVSDKIVIFCEAGQIKMPSTPSALCILLEKMVVEVCLKYDKKIGRYPAFHPKTWLLVFINDEGERQYRFVVLSRNLTFDRSWDISVAIDGKTGRKTNDSNSIKSFISFLNDHLIKDSVEINRQRRLLNAMLSELEYVTFELNDKAFSSFEVMPLGIGAERYDIENDYLFTDTFHEIAIMSPFLSKSTIEKFNDERMGLTDAKRTLITRRSELSKLKPEACNRFNVYVLKDDIYNGEESLSEDNVEAQKQDIHAKMYLRRKYSDTSLYLGSMNASYAAINSNVEMMIRLDTKNRYLNTDIFLRDIFSGEPDNKNNPFELVQVLDDSNESSITESDKLEQIIKKICRMKPRAYVSANNEKFDVNIKFNEYMSVDEYDVKLYPFRSNRSCDLSEQVNFNELDLLQLSQFYKLEVKGSEETVVRIIMIPTTGIPDIRENEIVKSVVSNKKSFIEYVAFVLGDDYLLSLLESKQISKTGGNGEEAHNSMPAVYEKMLKTSLTDPDRLKEINYILRMIDDNDIVPDEFRDMYQVFRNTLRI